METKDMVKVLREFAERYNRAADLLEGRATNEIEVPIDPPAVDDHPKKKVPLTRAQQIAEVIKLQGPLFPKEVFKLTGMPKGSVGVVLSEKYGFKKNEDGRWALAD